MFACENIKLEAIVRSNSSMEMRHICTCSSI